MTTTTKTREARFWNSGTKALLLALLTLAATLAFLLAQTPTHASAFPGVNGKIAFASDRTTGTGVNNPEGDLEIFTMNPDGTAIKQLTKNGATDFTPSYSADGKRIVFSSLRTGNSDIFVMKADGSGQKDLSKNPAGESHPAFSPDGKKVAYQRDVTASDSDVFVMNADGTGQTALTTDPARDEDPTYSPKGDRIAFVSDRGFRGSEIFSMNVDGTQQTNLTQKPDFSDEDPSFSPDGQQIAFASNRDGAGDANDFDIFVMNADGTGSPNRPTSSRATDDNPAFSPDGKQIAFTSTRDGGDRDVFVMDAGGTNQTDITPNDRTEFSPDWQPTASSFTVTTASDNGDGACDSTCTLREAINASNATPGSLQNTIKFNIPGSGVQTITPSSALPSITRPVLVDGYTQPGASPNTLAKGTNAALKIELNGTGVSPATNGLNIATSNSTVRGLVINRFSSIGVVINGSANRIVGNFIGTDATGSLDRGNPADGVTISSSNSGNTIGGPLRADRNLISGNGLNGVIVEAGNNRVEGNLIGTKRDGLGALGNDRSGVLVANNAAGVNILGNSISSNGGLGIDLSPGFDGDGITANDPADADTGSNNLQNFPVITSAKNSSTKTTIAGKLNSTPGKTFKVQFFSNPSGGDEGKKFIGQKSVTTDGSGNASFTFSPASKVAAGQNITATATDPAGNTSELSAPRTVALATGSNLSPETTKVSGPSGVTMNPTAHFAFTSPDPDATFECSPDGGAYYGCSSPENINRLSEGRHAFDVRAVDAKGNLDSSPAEWIWAVERSK